MLCQAQHIHESQAYSLGDSELYVRAKQHELAVFSVFPESKVFFEASQLLRPRSLLAALGLQESVYRREALGLGGKGGACPRHYGNIVQKE